MSARLSAAALVYACAALVYTTPASADDPPAPPAPSAAPSAAPIDVAIRGASDRPSPPDRAGSKVDRKELSEALPRSAPDALRYEPGVYVQQSAHGQGSPFVRGRTGQQVLTLVDGIRLNNSTFRQGPNQYFYSVDARSIHSIEVVRGGVSTQYGSDAIAGMILARPIEPTNDPSVTGFALRPRVEIHGTTADDELGFRLQADAQYGERLRFIGGFGSRKAGPLRASGAVCSPGTARCTPESPEAALVPRFEDDGRTQLGTGFRELTGDARLVYTPRPGHRLVAATYVYRQFDAPRTDQCPPPFANRVECLTIDEAFRTLAYLSYRGGGAPFARTAEATLSFQRQHERRTRDRPQSFIQNGGRDDVNTLGALAKLSTDEWRPLPWLGLRLKYGADLYDDRVDSAAWLLFTDNDILVKDTRGQYIAGSAFTQGGAYADVEAALPHGFTLRGGARAGFSFARAPADPQSGSLPVDQTWPLTAGHVGLESQPLPELRLFAHYDRSFRSPNLDDLTSRQQAGPGFQIENADLEPETADTFEIGARVDLPFLSADFWAYRSVLLQPIVRASRPIAGCPPLTPQCNSSWARYQLVNLDGEATVTGFEVSARAYLPFGLEAKGAVSYAFGESPNPQDRPDDPKLPYEEVVPLSRVPPLNGNLELRWETWFGAYVGAALRWADSQSRLAITDRSDARIPLGGTPGFAVFDLRAGYRLSRTLLLAAVLENLTDVPYRTHGSSINGPERGAVVSLEGGL